MQDKKESAYNIITREGVGRCVVAARDLKVRNSTHRVIDSHEIQITNMLNLMQPLDLIMEDGPAATGPEEYSSSPVCIACCRDLSGRIECHRYCITF